jgi:signal transduction histidine kinase
VMAVDTGLEDVEMHVLGAGDLSLMSPPSLGMPASELLTDLVEDVQAVPDVIGQTHLAHYPLVCGGQWVGGMFWSAGAAKADLTAETADTLAMAMALAVAMVEGRERDSVLSEQLARESQQLYAMQKALTETRALAAVGEMASGAAHEINNPLAVIAGRAQLMAEAGAEADRQTWKIMAEQAQKISDIVSEMMEFARPPAPKCDLTSVQALIDAAVAEAHERKETSDLKVDISVASDTPDLLVDIEQMTAVLVELMVNARAACKIDPRVRIEAARGEVGGQVLLRIVDNGAGMDADTLNKAFTPFFSSRAAGRRRGMGLSKARRMLQLVGGSIRMASEVGKGTTVFIQLPQAADAAQTGEAEEVA